MNDTPRIRFATTSDGVRIAYSTSGEGPPLVYVQGWVSHLELDWQRPDLRPFLERLGRERTLVLFDNRGTGLSDRNVDDVSLAARVKDLEAVVHQLGLDQFELFAWSNGTPVAIVYAAQHPQQVSRLMLFASFCGREAKDEREEAVRRALLDLIRAKWGVGARTTMSFVHPDADASETAGALQYLRASSTGNVAAAILEDGFFHVNVCHELERIAAPMLVVHRRHDHAVPLESGRRVAALAPNARFVLLDGDHHKPSDGDVDSLMQAIDEFLGRKSVPVASARPVVAGAPITVLLTDMEGSTSLTDRLGDAAAQELVRTHNAIVREALAAHGGTEVKHTGDGIMASFPSASRAVECAIQIQRALARHNDGGPEGAVHLRIGLNAGEPVEEGGDLFGQTVQAAARITALAEPDQILVADVVRQLVAGKGFLFADQGEVPLRGFEDPVRLFEVRWAEP